MKDTIVYMLLEDACLSEGGFIKGDVVSAETLEKIMKEYYEIKVKLVRIL